MSEDQELRKAGLRSTQPRLKILDALEKSTVRHMSAEDVYRQLLEGGEEIGLATVYRVLTQFESAGLVIRHNFEGGRAVFELNDASHHDHMLCAECGRVFEFYDRTIEERQKRIAQEAGFVIADHSLYLYGVCVGMKEHGQCSMRGQEKEGIMVVGPGRKR
jgi:Fur family ferric uptake transcriptional regulator